LVATDERKATERGGLERRRRRNGAIRVLRPNETHAVRHPVAISFFAFCDGGRTSMFSLVPGQRERHREIA